MITIIEYQKLIKEILNCNLSNNIQQKQAIFAQVNESQHIIAGPGSGKTTVLVLKILKYIFVDRIKPEEIIVTTFTKKAANQIKERTISWANLLVTELGMDCDIDFEKILIGTIDSIAEDIVNIITPVEIIDNFTSSAIMMQTLLLDQRNTDKKLKQFLKRFKDISRGLNTSDMNNELKNIRERIYYDMVDEKELQKNISKEKIMYNIFDEYSEQLKLRNIYDYVLLENKFYTLLNTQVIDELKSLKILLIDEYQDTNLLQEQIYFKLAKYVQLNNGNITVVGDEDQSLYRFRGATVNLFTDYVSRLKKELSIEAKTIFLQVNYRSTRNIINFTNEYLHLDENYNKSRTSNKSLIIPSSNSKEGLPILGMFRNNLKELSVDLSNLIYSLKLGNDYKIERHGEIYNIKVNKKNPSIVLLMNSPREITVYNNKRLPFYLREILSSKIPTVPVFNPRGQNIESTEIISVICGLLLITIDYNSCFEEKIENIPPHAKKILLSWRKKAKDYVIKQSITLKYNSEKINLNDLMNDISVIVKPLLKDTHENEVYADIIYETIKQTDNAINVNDELTVNQIFWHILVPIATGAIDIDDDLFEENLDNNFNIMSIHQAKGLEFDIVIVDVGSDILNKNKNNDFKRYPSSGGKTFKLERYLRKYSVMDFNINVKKGINNAFDDLIKRYFVAFTRSKSLLILVGLNNMRFGYKGDFQSDILIPNVATGWSRDNKWHWEYLNNLIQL